MKPTETEQAVLDLVLREMRHAVAVRSQLEIMYDPWVGDCGVYVNVSHSTTGYQTEFAGPIRGRKKRGRK